MSPPYIYPTMKVKINKSPIFWYLSYLYTPYMTAYRGWQSQKHVPVQKWESSVTSELQMQKQAVINLHLVCMLISIPLACWFYLLVVLADFMLALFADLHACWYIIMRFLLADFMLDDLHACWFYACCYICLYRLLICMLANFYVGLIADCQCLFCLLISMLSDFYCLFCLPISIACFACPACLFPCLLSLLISIVACWS